MNWPIRNSAQIRNQIQFIDNTIMWNTSLFYISNRFCRTPNNFGPLNDHIITVFSWVVTIAPAVPSGDILWWPVTSQWPSSRRLKLYRICHIRAQKLLLGLRNIYEWWRGRCSHTMARLEAILCLTWLIHRSHRRRYHDSNFLTAVTYSSQSNSKLYVQKNNYVPNSPVELAHCRGT